MCLLLPPLGKAFPGDTKEDPLLAQLVFSIFKLSLEDIYYI